MEYQFGDEPVPTGRRKKKGKYDTLIEVWPVGRNKRFATKSESIAICKALRIRGFGFKTQVTDQGINVWKTNEPENHAPVKPCSARCSAIAVSLLQSGLHQDC